MKILNDRIPHAKYEKMEKTYSLKQHCLQQPTDNGFPVKTVFFPAFSRELETCDRKILPESGPHGTLPSTCHTGGRSLP